MNKIHCIDPIGQGLQWKMLQCIYKSFLFTVITLSYFFFKHVKIAHFEVLN